MRVLIVNASLGGEEGNTEPMLVRIRAELEKRGATTMVRVLTAENGDEVLTRVGEANGLVFGTGTYWDSWSSALQIFLERATVTEGTPIWLGKPVGVVVTMHGVGGKAVLSRLQGVLNTFGCLIPPMSGLVYSRVNHEVLKRSGSAGESDLWRPADLAVIAENLVVALRMRKAASKENWTSWDVDGKDFEAKWNG